MTTLYSLPPEAARWVGPDRQAVRRMGLRVFIVVVSMLFFLFGAAYVMRMAVSDWRPLPVVPWQLWISSALLVAASMAWQLAWRAALRGMETRAKLDAALACGASILFLGAQLWAWHSLDGLGLTVAANPANSFFYLITGLHGLHVLGGLFAAALAGWPLMHGGGVPRASGAIELCARYWHFLLLLWLAMFAMLFLVTPAVVQAICGTP